MKVLIAGLALALVNGAEPPVAPNAVTDLRVAAVTDTSLVLSWTEVSTNGAGIAKYVIRVAPDSAGFFSWVANTDVKVGGCAAPVYGSTGAGGRTRSCVLGGAKPRVLYDIQLAAYTGTLNVNAVFGPLSNVARGITAERVGSMLVIRPSLNQAETFQLTNAWIDAYPDTFPMRGTWNYGTHLLAGFQGDSLVAWGYLLIGKP